MSLLFSGRAVFSRTIVGIAQWATRIGPTAAYSITSDSTGNIYVAGVYSSDPLTAYNTPGTATTIPTLASSGGTTDVYVVKYSSSGIAQWATRMNTGSSTQTVGITSDSMGNIYVTGSYDSNPLTVYNQPGTSSTITLANSGGSEDVFVVKYDSSGTAQWATRIAAGSYEEGVGITSDSAGNIYVTGRYESNPVTVYSWNGTPTGTPFGTLSNSGGSDAFVVKYNSSGVAQWATRIAGANSDQGRSITVDSSGDIYVTGSYISNPLTVYDASGTSSMIPTLANSGGFENVFIVKYSNSSGVAQWATRIAGANSDKGTGITSDSAGNIYVTGLYASNPLTVYNAPGTDTTIPTLAISSGSDTFVVKYDSSGTAQWATRVNTGVGMDPSITSDSAGNIYVIGSYGAVPLTVYNAPGTSSTIPTLPAPAGMNDAFVVKYNSSGVAQWATRITSDYTIGYDITSDSVGYIYVTGVYSGEPGSTVYNAPGINSTIPTLASSGVGFDAFIVKFMS
jgi:hypothetical protein